MKKIVTAFASIALIATAVSAYAQSISISPSGNVRIGTDDPTKAGQGRDTAPGQLKKEYGGSATDYAPGQQKKQGGASLNFSDQSPSQGGGAQKSGPKPKSDKKPSSANKPAGGKGKNQ